MKSIRFWRMEVQQLTLTERIFFRDAISTLMAWKLLNEEFRELELIKKVLESEIRIIDPESLADKYTRKGAIFRT